MKYDTVLQTKLNLVIVFVLKFYLCPDVISQYFNSEYAVVLEEFAGWFELRPFVLLLLKYKLLVFIRHLNRDLAFDYLYSSDCIQCIQNIL